MKLVIAVVHPKDADACTDGLTSAGFICTRINSFGGFLDRQNVTLMVGVDTPLVDDVMAVLRRSARRRNETLEAGSAVGSVSSMTVPIPMDVEVGGATVFVVDVDRFEKL